MGYLYYLTYMDEVKLKNFHGENYSKGPWNSKQVSECRLCKSKNSNGNLKHWASGLCRSCYRRLSINHRLYNDSWNQENSTSAEIKKAAPKKSYKDVDDVQVSDTDVETLLERYDFRCAYCETLMQGHTHTALNAFQLEFKIKDSNKAELIPICRSCNCSKKNINDVEKLRRWAQERGLAYPFNFKAPLK